MTNLDRLSVAVGVWIERELPGWLQKLRQRTGSTKMKFLRVRQVMQLTGLSRMTIYRLELAGEFPKRRQLSKNSVAWLDTDIAQWAESRPVSRLRGTARAPLRSVGVTYD
jgi:prophage regulatory protein